MRFKIDWASLIVGSTFTVFPMFYFAFEGVTGFGGLIHGGAYFRKFTVVVFKNCKTNNFSNFISVVCDV